MIKKFKYLILNLILLCLFLFSITSVSILNVYAYTPITEVDEYELYNQTNTYDISSSCFNEDGSFKTVNDTNRDVKTQYSLQYNFTSKNENETILYAGYYNDFSNALPAIKICKKGENQR